MNTEISTQTISYDESGSGPAIVLLHAFPLSRSMWASQMEALQGAYRVIAPDLRGFGGSKGFDEPPSLDQVADDVAGLLDELKISERIVLGGLSMGGYAALAFARRHAGRLRGLILADTKAEADDTEGKANRERSIAFAGQNTARAVLDQMLPKLLAPETMAAHPEVLDVLRHIATDQTPAAIIGALRAMRDRPDSGPSLSAIAVPTLVIVGEKDALTPPALAETLAARIRGAKLMRIAGAGHLSNLEKPELFNAAVRSFLQELATGAA
ncbi:MAG TPA: alpha/beta fold hydrolase [Gemmataceae bacterium]|nr:alpha/beta fold hydrolase [Gemmataceae bacterium]